MKLSDLLKEIEEEEGNSSKDESINYKMMFFKYISKWYWFAIGLFICLSIAVVHTYFSTPQYMVTTKLLLKDEEKGADFNSNAVVADMLGFSSSSSVENEAEVLKAENLMVKTFDELNLTHSYYKPHGKFRWTELYGAEVPIQLIMHTRKPIITMDGEEDAENFLIVQIINEDEFELETPSGAKKTYSFGKRLSNQYGEFSIVKNPALAGSSDSVEVVQVVENEPIRIEFYDPKAVAKYYAENLTVDIVNKLASVVSISLLDAHPKKGTDIMLKLIDVYNQEAENEKNTIARNTITFIDEQLVGLTDELKEIEGESEQYKLNNSITDVSAEAQLYLSSTTVNRQQLSEFSIQIDVLESIESYLKNQGSEYEMVPSTLSIQDPTLTGLIANFNQLQRERERMLRTTQPNNPIVLNINQQLSSLRSSIIENLRNIKNGLMISRDNLQATSNQFQGRASRVPTMERELLEISRQQGIKQQHYLYLIQKREEAILTLAATTVSNTKIIDPPASSDYPVSPNKKLTFAFSLMLGLAIPFGFLFIKDLWQGRIELKSDVEKITSTKVLGEISRNPGKSGVIAIKKNKRTLIAEQFRFIRSNLAFSTYQQANKVIMVTSGISGEGKTFFSINLAISLGLTGKRVVVLEFDLRKPAMLSALGMEVPIGISEYLEQDIYELDEIIHPLTEAENVSIIGCGKIPENPAELMMGDKLLRLLEDLSSRFDYVVIDTAPIGLVSDSFMLSEIADVTIFMLRYNYSTRAQVKTIEDIRLNKKFKLPLIVLNDAKLEMTYGYTATYGKNYYQNT
ncbi:polysaccharide biosynthesis tyrosine autokinase [Algoriphagus jejuensis]|uniref:non-specific protein-tyrosine kinase n=1 Tax=Algoriphagus jejuensis TaxID=419934 RepID=A0ABP3YGK9_9BACT